MLFKQSNYVLAGLLSMVLVPTLVGESVKQVEDCVKNNERVVIMFSRSSCPYCKYLKPLFNKLQKGVTGVVFKVVTVTSELRKKYNFSTWPTVIYFKNGKIVGRHGSNNGSMTLARMRKYLNKTK